MDAMISQTEIDALLQARRQESTVPPARLEDSDLPLLTELLGEFVQRALATVTEATGTPCEGLLSDVAVVPVSGVSNLGAPQVFVGTSGLAGGLTGFLHYVVPFPFGLLLVAELEKHAPSTALPKASVQAVGDFLSQLNQAGWSALGSVLGRKVNAQAVTTAVAGSLAEKTQESASARVLNAGIDLAVGDAMGRLLLVLPESVAALLVQAVKAKQQPEPQRSIAPEAATPAPAQAAVEPAAPAPAPAPAPVPANTMPPAQAQVATIVETMLPQAAPAPTTVVSPPPRNLELLKDVVLQITVELGRTHRKLKDVLALGPGSVLELDRLANEQVDVMVNGKPIAKAEVVVVDENYGARVTEVISPGERVRTFG